MDKQALKTLTMRLLNENVSAACVKRDAIQETIDRIENDPGDQYEGVMRSFTGDEERLILEGLQLILTQEQATVAEAVAALKMYEKGEA